mgnify:CR=1 FL=1
MNKGTIVITGGAGGLGASCARTLKDHKLVITDYSKDAVDRTVAELKAAGIDAVGHACDITDPKAVHGLKEFARAQGNLKGLVHTAGVSGTVATVCRQIRAMTAPCATRSRTGPTRPWIPLCKAAPIPCTTSPSEG